jgi:hypothetical protein
MRKHITKKHFLFAVAMCCCALVALAIGLNVTGGSQNDMERIASQTLAQSSTRQDEDKDVEKDADKAARMSAEKAADKDAGKGAAGSDDSGSSDTRSGVVGDAADKDADGGAGARGSGADNAGLDGDAAGGADDDIPDVSVDGASVPDVPVTSDADVRDVAVADGRTHVASPTGATAVELVDEPVFTIPDGADYVPEEILVTVDKGVDSIQLARQLKKRGARTVDVDSAQWITDDMVRLNVSRESTVEEAVNELLMSGTALDAQPNYLYSVDDSMTPGQIALRAMQ